MIDLSNFVESIELKPIAVFGLAKSGVATIKALKSAEKLAGNVEVIVWDDNPQRREEALALGAVCQALNVETLAQCGCLVLSPGVPLTHPVPHDVVKAAQTAGIEIIGDIEVMHRALSLDPADTGKGRERSYKTVGITGTNGKSTTTALLTHVLEQCGKPVAMGGNIGEPVLLMDPPDNGTVIVLEVSSYQIDLCPTFRPDIGVLLNVTPDHIDRHGSFENYKAIKENFVRESGSSVYGEQLDINDAVFDDNTFVTLPGDHNRQNILCVLEVCKHLGVDREQAIDAIKSFPGLAHRQFLVRDIKGVCYVNDSKATNAEATSKALKAFQNIYWIVGGQAKDGGLTGLEEFAPRIAHAYLIGEAAPEFAKWMDAQNIAYTLSETLESAVKKAHDDTQKQGNNVTVLLSPACASWDQFKSFEHRGDVFADVVGALS